MNNWLWTVMIRSLLLSLSLIFSNEIPKTTTTTNAFLITSSCPNRVANRIVVPQSPNKALVKSRSTPSPLCSIKKDDDDTSTTDSHLLVSQRRRSLVLLLTPLLILSTPFVSSNAAPPMAVIAEELGYFPVTNRNGQTMYIPARVKRRSTDQAVEFSNYLRDSKATMYGAFWCPHCQRQREMFGREAWNNVNYVECSPQGEGALVGQCTRNGIESFPTWKFQGGRSEVSGEMPLEQLARAAGYPGVFDNDKEEPLSSNSVSSGACR